MLAGSSWQRVWEAHKTRGYPCKWDRGYICRYWCIGWDQIITSRVGNASNIKPCRGILLFGPPGTANKMLAKPIANEAAVQVSLMSQCQPSFTLKWFGED